MPDEDRTITRERQVYADHKFDVQWIGRTTRPGHEQQTWNGGGPGDVIEHMDYDLGKRPESDYRIVEGGA